MTERSISELVGSFSGAQESNLDDGSSSFKEFMNSTRYEKLVEKSLQISHFKIDYENPWSIASDTVLKVEICEQKFPASLRKQ